MSQKKYYSKFFTSLLKLFSVDKQLLENRGSFIIRFVIFHLLTVLFYKFCWINIISRVVERFCTRHGGEGSALGFLKPQSFFRGQLHCRGDVWPVSGRVEGISLLLVVVWRGYLDYKWLCRRILHCKWWLGERGGISAISGRVERIYLL